MSWIPIFRRCKRSPFRSPVVAPHMRFFRASFAVNSLVNEFICASNCVSFSIPLLNDIFARSFLIWAKRRAAVIWFELRRFVEYVFLSSAFFSIAFCSYIFRTKEEWNEAKTTSIPNLTHERKFYKFTCGMCNGCCRRHNLSVILYTIISTNRHMCLIYGCHGMKRASEQKKIHNKQLGMCTSAGRLNSYE